MPTWKNKYYLEGLQSIKTLKWLTLSTNESI